MPRHFKRRSQNILVRLLLRARVLPCLQLKRSSRPSFHEDRLIRLPWVQHVLGLPFKAALSITASLRPLHSTSHRICGTRLARQITEFLRVLVPDRNLL